MAKKDLDADAVSRSSPVDTVPPGIWYIAGVSLIGWIMYRTGYAAGTSISSQVLRRHDKDARRMKKEAEKREKQLRKELSPETENKWKWWPW